MLDNTFAQVRNVLSQITAVTIINGLTFTMGSTSGYATILIPGLSQKNNGTEIYLNQEELSWIGSIRYICVPVGCLSSIVITHQLGRKRTAQLVSLVYVASWIIVSFANGTWQIYSAIGLMGVCGGLLEAPVTTYIGEVTQPHLRGMLVATATMFYCIGIFITFVIGAFMHWREVARYCLSIPAATLVLLFFIPESPNWLIMKNRLGDAGKSLAWLRGWTTTSATESEFKELCVSIQTQHAEAIFTNLRGTIMRFTEMSFLRPLALISFILLITNLGGILTLLTYAFSIFTELEVVIDNYYATILLGVSQLVASFVTISLVRILGKRVLTFSTMILGIIGLIAIATYAYLLDTKYLSTGKDVQTIEGYQWFPLLCLISIVFFLQCGIFIVPWLLMAEVFTNETKTFAVSFLSSFGYVLGFCHLKTFYQIMSEFRLTGMFMYFAGVNLIGVIVLYFCLPETEGKLLVEITNHYAGKTKLDNKVRRIQSTIDEQSNL